MAKELLFSITKKDLDIQFFSGTGAGGQYRNKHQNCVRMTHKESGVTTTGQSNRERNANLTEAFNNLVKHPKFKFWHTAKTNEILTGKTIEKRVEESLKEENLKVEYRIDNKWQEQQNIKGEEIEEENKN